MNERHIKVLLIDDDEDDYVMTRDLLSEIKGGGYHLDWVADYATGLATISHCAHDVYLLDYRLGEHNGLDLLHEAVASGCRAPMILMTGQGDHEVDVEAMKAGAADYLIKGQVESSLLGRSLRYAIERTQALAALRESEERFQRLVEISPDAIIVHADGKIVFINSAGVKLLGAANPSQILERPVIDFVHSDYRATVDKRIARVNADAAEPAFVEEKFVRLDGTIIDVEVAAVPFLYNDQPAVQMVARDIGERKRVEEKLLHDAFHDQLTGLPNRALFHEHLKLAVERSKRPKKFLFAVLFIDLDRFKNVNDSLGHMAGDTLLVAFAHRLQTSLRDMDAFARMGGDEFAILLNGIEDPSDAIRVAERLHEELVLPFDLDGHDVFTSVSIGIALSSTGYDKPQDVLRDADTAMYHAKMLGKARHEVFDHLMHARAVALLQMETDLRRAVERDEFRVHYQPIVSFQSGEIEGFEALVRWQHPERGLIFPTQFIALAEETGLIIPIGWWVLHEACRQMRQWQLRYSARRTLKLSVNLSGKQLSQTDAVERIKQIMELTDFDPHQLNLEITESALIENTDGVTLMLTQLRALGVRLSMDDFGTGYSSLSYLHRFPLNTLKIDRSFISQMSASDKTAIVHTIILLAQNLGMNVIAEGVETSEQMELLRALNCDYGQGYLFSPPVDAAAVAELLQARQHYCDVGGALVSEVGRQ